MDDSDYLPNVRAQYEELPYPRRNPLDEAKRLQTTVYDCLDRINHYCFSGKKDFLLGSRVLVVAGGTGDTTIFLAEQLRDTDSEIVYLDMSKASLEIAKERAKIRGLDNIKWIHDSLLNIPSLNLGKFDYISCTGALHHLEDPNAGLAALKHVLKDDGAMMIMVYAQYGRTAVYQIQSLMRLINQNETDTLSQINNCHKVLDALPPNHWYKLSNFDHKKDGNTELLDRFLHTQDRAYTIPELYDFLESADLKLACLFPQMEKMNNDLNNPSLYIKDAELLTFISKLDLKQQQTISELMHGRITQHSFYTAKKIQALPDPNNFDFIPSLSLIAPAQTYNILHQLICSKNGYIKLTVNNTNDNFGFQKTPNMEDFFRYLDGNKSFKDIYDAIISTKNPEIHHLSHETLNQEFKEMISVMKLHNSILLRHKSVSSYLTSEEIQSRMK